MNTQLIAKICEQAGNGGIFLTTQGSKLNTMILGWCTSGIMWGKSVLMVPVRQTRFTKTQMKVGDDFTVSISSPQMKDAVRICGTKSGYNMDKFVECGLHSQEARKVSVPVIKEGLSHIECKIIAAFDMNLDNITQQERKRWYDDETMQGNGDNFHTLYFGEIIEVY